MVKKKTKSHRQDLKTKYLIQKKSKSHRKKIKKMGKDNPMNGRSKIRKDPGIPNLWPYKEQLMKKVVEAREELELRKKNKNRTIVENTMNQSMDYESPQTPMDEDTEMQFGSNNKIQSGNYFKELRKVIEESDVVLQVLDARDPMGCRCQEFEEKVGSSGKKLVLVLNKIDLIPTEITEKWLNILRKEFPTVAFKASTQEQRNNVGVYGKGFSHKTVSDSQSLSLSECVGAGELMQLLKNYTRSLNTKTAITVGIIGYPNVGKSSIINSLKRSKSAGVGSTPGFTKCVQEVHIDSKIKLLDSPGVLLDVKNTGESVLALRNSVSISKIEDPISVIQNILEKVSIDSLCAIYGTRKVETCEQLLLEVAAKKGKLKKRGVADLEQTALAIVQDWNNGVIPFYTLPPEDLVFKSMVSVVQNDSEAHFDPMNPLVNVVTLPGTAQDKSEKFAIDMKESYDFKEHF